MHTLTVLFTWLIYCTLSLRALKQSRDLVTMKGNDRMAVSPSSNRTLNSVHFFCTGWTIYGQLAISLCTHCCQWRAGSTHIFMPFWLTHSQHLMVKSTLSACPSNPFGMSYHIGRKAYLISPSCSWIHKHVLHLTNSLAVFIPQ